MSKTYSISETCSCGAKFVYSDRVDQAYYSHLDYEHSRFLEAHKPCREKQAVISDNKELKDFLVNKVRQRRTDNE